MANLKERVEVEFENKVAEDVRQYLAFRHFFSHAYALDLYATQIEPLVQNTNEVFKRFQIDIQKFY